MIWKMMEKNGHGKKLLLHSIYILESVMRYLDKSDNHVLYRVSPYFKDNELLARGVEMEAYSIEDKGKGICFHVFVYNIQPGIKLDYRTGANSVE